MSHDIGNVRRRSGMSKARLVITAVVVEGRTQAEVARNYGVSRPGSTLMARYAPKAKPRSNRVHDDPDPPDRSTPRTVELILELRDKLADAGLDAGPDTIAWHLAPPPPHTLSPGHDRRIPDRAGLVTPEPKKRPKSSYIRFEADHAQRDLAIRLHPLAALDRRRPTSRSSAGSTTAPATPSRHRPPPGHRPIVLATFRESR